MVSFIVVYDACVLYPASLRDLLMRLARANLFQAKWTEEILDEVFENLIADRPDLDPLKLAVTRQRMCDAVTDCLVTKYQGLVPALELPDAKDRHVLAAAIRSGAQVVVTDNIKDFPDGTLADYGIEAQTADQFVLHVMDLAPEVVVEIVKRQAADLQNPPHTPEDVLERLALNGLVCSVAKLRKLL